MVRLPCWAALTRRSVSRAPVGLSASLMSFIYFLILRGKGTKSNCEEAGERTGGVTPFVFVSDHQPQTTDHRPLSASPHHQQPFPLFRERARTPALQLSKNRSTISSSSPHLFCRGFFAWDLTMRGGRRRGGSAFQRLFWWCSVVRARRSCAQTQQQQHPTHMRSLRTHNFTCTTITTTDSQTVRPFLP